MKTNPKPYITKPTRKAVMEFSLHIQELALQAIIGFNPEERRTPQTILIDLTIEYSCARSNLDHDCLVDVIDYSVVIKEVSDYVASTSFVLLETLCEKLLQFLCQRYPALIACHITVQKPQLSLGCAAIRLATHYTRRLS